MRKLIIPALLAAITLAGLPSGAAVANGYTNQKVVYHINFDDPKKQAGAMRNIQNHINAVGADKLDLRVVMHGNGVSLLKRAKENPDFESKVVSLKSQNIKFQVCNNTLKGRKISYENDLFDVYPEDIVPSGVAEIAHLQGQGFAYIKP